MKNLRKLSALSPFGLALALAVPTTVMAQNLCDVSYTTANSWGNGAQIAVAVTNNGAPVSSWQVCWTFNGSETIDIQLGLVIEPQADARLIITRANGDQTVVTVTLRIDTPIEVDYYRAGGILPFVLRQLLEG